MQINKHYIDMLLVSNEDTGLELSLQIKKVI